MSIDVRSSKNSEYRKRAFNVPMHRWLSYYHQISEVLELAGRQPKTFDVMSSSDDPPPKVLLIGIGDGITPAILTIYGMQVTTFDITDTLSPDVLGDVKEIDRHFQRNSYDVIVCCQVLEHLEYSFFESILKQFQLIAPTVVLALPCNKIPLFTGVVGLPGMLLWLHLSFKRIKQKMSHSSHLWEVGTKGCSTSQIRNVIKNHFDIISEYPFLVNACHRYYVLGRKGIHNI